ncbi:MAG: FeoB-associated Cys-rich membrane protein [Lachnospiraceae bacterium]|nr:FeoB-associated Cys-rich membrane protein [Lachnospiraceae bacterium]
MGTLLVGAILLIIIALIIKSMVKDKKSGKSLQCGGQCDRCKMNCH